MKIKTILVGIFLLLLSKNIYAERSMYVDDFASILGNTTLENELLSYSQTHNISILLLYDLHVINQTHDLTDSATNYILAAFITNAKTNYGITLVGAIGENASFFTNIINTYNNSRSNALEKIDIYNIEFEFWNPTSTTTDGYYCTTYLEPNDLPCTVDGAFQYYNTALQTINDLANANTHTVSVETYVGWITETQAITISQNVDRLLLHAYVTNPTTAFNYTKDRIMALANGNNGLNVSVIFSAEPDFMQDWLLENSMEAAENIFISDWTTGSENWDNNINLDGFTYFAYTFSTNISLETDEIIIDKLKVYPNPVKKLLHINKNINSVKVYSKLGQLLLSTKENMIDFSAFSKGIYVLKIDTENGCLIKKLIKH